MNATLERPTTKGKEDLPYLIAPETAYRQHVFAAVDDGVEMQFNIIDRADRMTADFTRHTKRLRDRRATTERRRTELPRLDKEIAELERRDAEFRSIGQMKVANFATLIDLSCALRNLDLSAGGVDSPFRQTLLDTRDVRARLDGQTIEFLNMTADSELHRQSMEFGRAITAIRNQIAVLHPGDVARKLEEQRTLCEKLARGELRSLYRADSDPRKVLLNEKAKLVDLKRQAEEAPARLAQVAALEQQIPPLEKKLAEHMKKFMDPDLLSWE